MYTHIIGRGGGLPLPPPPPGCFRAAGNVRAGLARPPGSLRLPRRIVLLLLICVFV